MVEFGIWTVFTECLLQCFRLDDQLNFNTSFSYVSQKGFLEAYFNEFIRLSCRAQGWTDEQLLGVFLGRLKLEL